LLDGAVDIVISVEIKKSKKGTKVKWVAGVKVEVRKNIRNFLEGKEKDTRTNQVQS